MRIKDSSSFKVWERNKDLKPVLLFLQIQINIKLTSVASASLNLGILGNAAPEKSKLGFLNVWIFSICHLKNGNLNGCNSEN